MPSTCEASKKDGRKYTLSSSCVMQLAEVLCSRTPTLTCTHTPILTCANTPHSHVHPHPHLFTHMHTHPYSCIYTPTPTYIHIPTLMHSHTHTLTHMHSYTHPHAFTHLLGRCSVLLAHEETGSEQLRQWPGVMQCQQKISNCIGCCLIAHFLEFHIRAVS